MNKLILISILVSVYFCQTHTDGVCPGTEVADGTHYQLYIGSVDKCILKGAIDSFFKLSDAIKTPGVVSGAVVDQTFELSFTISDPTDCGSGSEACFKPEFYSVSLTNKNDQDAAEASGTLTNSKVVLDSTKIDDITNWCGAPDGVTGVIQCTITASYGYTGVSGGEILSIPVTVEITKNTDSITVVVDDPVSVTGNNQDSSAGHQSTYLIDREATLTRHENDSFDDTVLTNPQKGDNIFLQIALDNATDQAIGPFKTSDYEVILVVDGSELNITDNVSNPQTVNIGTDGSDNHVFRFQVQMNYVGTYNLKVEVEQPTPTVSGRILEEVKPSTVKNVAKSFLSVTVLPKK